MKNEINKAIKSNSNLTALINKVKEILNVNPVEVMNVANGGYTITKFSLGEINCEFRNLEITAFGNKVESVFHNII